MLDERSTLVFFFFSSWPSRKRAESRTVMELRGGGYSRGFLRVAGEGILGNEVSRWIDARGELIC